MEWIRTEDNVPAEGRKVLCFERDRDSGSIFVAWRHKFHAKSQHEFIAWNMVERNEFWPQPTHWMPLPAAPSDI